MPNPITLKEFFKLLEEGKGTLGIQNRSFHEELVIDEKNVNILTKLHLNFSNCIFNKNLILRNLTIHFRISNLKLQLLNYQVKIYFS